MSGTNLFSQNARKSRIVPNFGQEKPKIEKSNQFANCSGMFLWASCVENGVRLAILTTSMSLILDGYMKEFAKYLQNTVHEC